MQVVIECHLRGDGHKAARAAAHRQRQLVARFGVISNNKQRILFCIAMPRDAKRQVIGILIQRCLTVAGVQAVGDIAHVQGDGSTSNGLQLYIILSGLSVERNGGVHITVAGDCQFAFGLDHFHRVVTLIISHGRYRLGLPVQCLRHGYGGLAHAVAQLGILYGARDGHRLKGYQRQHMLIATFSYGVGLDSRCLILGRQRLAQ